MKIELSKIESERDCQISLIKMIMEMVESEPIYTKTFSPEIRLINLDTISSKLKELTDGK